MVYTGCPDPCTLGNIEAPARREIEGNPMRKSKATVRNALLLLACIVVFLVCAVIIANNVGQGLS